MRVVLAAVWTELLHFQPFGGGFFVLGAGVVPVFALGALERDNFSWHLFDLSQRRPEWPPVRSKLLTSYNGGPSDRRLTLN